MSPSNSIIRPATQDCVPPPPRPRSDAPSQPLPSLQQLFHETQPTYNAKHLLDLRLMHHYSVVTADHFAKTFPERVSPVLKINLPRLACEHAFLMDAILLVAVVHMASTEPVAEGSLPVYLYRHQALRSLRQAVADVTPQTSGPVLGASALLATVSFAADRIARQSGLWMANWLALVNGQRTFRGPSWDDARHPFSALAQAARGTEDMPPPSSLYGAFADIPGPGVAPVHVQQALGRPDGGEGGVGVDWAQREALHASAQELGRLVCVLARPYEELWLERQIKSWAWDMVPSEFPELVRRSQPQALVIIAYYLVVFKLMPESWTYEGVANHDIDEICSTIDPSWAEYLAVPKMALQIEDKPALVDLLLRSMPGRD